MLVYWTTGFMLYNLLYTVNIKLNIDMSNQRLGADGCPRRRIPEMPNVPKMDVQAPRDDLKTVIWIFEELVTPVISPSLVLKMMVISPI